MKDQGTSDNSSSKRWQSYPDGFLHCLWSVHHLRRMSIIHSACACTPIVPIACFNIWVLHKWMRHACWNLIKWENFGDEGLQWLYCRGKNINPMTVSAGGNNIEVEHLLQGDSDSDLRQDDHSSSRLVTGFRGINESIHRLGRIVVWWNNDTLKVFEGTGRSHHSNQQW